MFQSKEEKKVDLLAELDAILEFLNDIKTEVKILTPKLQQLQELERERLVADSGLLQVNLETQAKVLEIIIQHYEYFENDVDINGLRLKQMARQFLRNCEKAGLKDLVKEKEKSVIWQMFW